MNTQYPGGLIVYYYYKGNGNAVGSLSYYKILRMSARYDAEINVCGIAEFHGELLSDEYL